MARATLLNAIILVVYLIHMTTAASLNSRSTRSVLDKLTCRHQNEAKKKIWKTNCVKANEPHHEIPSYKVSGLNLLNKLSYSAIPALEIPPKYVNIYCIYMYLLYFILTVHSGALQFKSLQLMKVLLNLIALHCVNCITLNKLMIVQLMICYTLDFLNLMELLQLSHQDMVVAIIQ